EPLQHTPSDRGQDCAPGGDGLRAADPIRNLETETEWERKKGTVSNFLQFRNCSLSPFFSPIRSPSPIFPTSEISKLVLPLLAEFSTYGESITTDPGIFECSFREFC